MKNETKEYCVIHKSESQSKMKESWFKSEDGARGYFNEKIENGQKAQLFVETTTVIRERLA